MSDLKTTFDTGFAKLLANLKAMLDASAGKLAINVKARLDASAGKLVNDLRATLAAIDARNKALLQRIGATLNPQAAPVLFVPIARARMTFAERRKMLVRRIRRFLRYLARVLMTGRLRPPVVVYREPSHPA